MTAEGFCLISQSDEPLNDRARCLPHGEIAIAPSWGDSRQRFCDGAWTPHVEKPANYAYKPKVHAIPAHAPISGICDYCGGQFTYPYRKGATPRYCPTVCRNRARRQREKTRVA